MCYLKRYFESLWGINNNGVSVYVILQSRLQPLVIMSGKNIYEKINEMFIQLPTGVFLILAVP